MLSIGTIGNAAADAIADAEQALPGVSIAHYDLRFVKPLDTALLEEVGTHFTRIVTVEDGILKGGVGSAVLEYMADHGHTPHIRRIGIPWTTLSNTGLSTSCHACGTDREGICRVLLEELNAPAQV